MACFQAVFRTLQALYQPQGGILASELCIAAHVGAAQARGAEFHPQEKVITWRVNEATGIVTVVTDKGSYTTSKLVLTAGAWMPDLCPELKVLPSNSCSMQWGVAILCGPINCHRYASRQARAARRQSRWLPQLVLGCLTCIQSSTSCNACAMQHRFAILYALPQRCRHDHTDRQGGLYHSQAGAGSCHLDAINWSAGHRTCLHHACHTVAQ